MATVERTEEQERLAEIEAMEQRVQDAESSYLRAKEEAKEAKEFYESRVIELRRLIRASKNDAERPLLNQQEEVATDWRKTPIEELALSASVNEKLAEANIKTLGDLADYSIDGAPLTGIKGIGEASAAKIEDRMAQFWQRHPEYVQAEESGDVSARPEEA